MNKSLNRLSTLLLIFLGVFPQIYLVADTLNCGVDSALPLWIAALCLFVWVAACYRRGILIGMPLSALCLFAAYRSYDTNPSVQLLDLFDRMTALYYERVYAPGGSYALPDVLDSHALLLIFLAFLLAAYLSAALTSRMMRIPLSLLGTLPIMFACLSANGKPSSLVILPFVLFVALLLVSGGGYVEDCASGKALFASLLPLTILLCALLLIYDPDRYRFNEEDIAVSQRMDWLTKAVNRWLEENSAPAEGELSPYLSIQLPAPTRAPGREQPRAGWGEMGGVMDLTQPFDFSVQGNSVLYATADLDATVYLRLFSYGDYAGTNWQAPEEPQGRGSLDFTARALRGRSESRQQRLSLRFVQHLPYLCQPYYSESGADTDAYVLSAGEEELTLRYLHYLGDMTQVRLADGELDAEPGYRDFAHSYYTRLPEETADALRALCAQAGIDSRDKELIQKVAAYVRQSSRYDLLTEAYPSDDYALYFLTEARRGYCIHFATAATALYRALGVPARMTVGYLLDAKQGEEVELTEADAHAWTEVYLDGLGWVPVEVTGQGGDLDTDAIGGEADDQPAQPSPAPASDSASPEEAESQGGQTKDPLPVGPVTVTTREQEAPSAEKAARLPLLLLPLVLLLLSSPFLWRMGAGRLLQRAYRQPDRRRAVVAVYRSAAYAEKLGAELPDYIKTCAEKASFSKHDISRRELRQCLELLEEELDALYPRLKPWDKFRLKFWKGLR